jgi:hypothetical protein
VLVKILHSVDEGGEETLDYLVGLVFTLQCSIV